MYLERFELPSEEVEDELIYAYGKKNGGYIDNGYPFKMFSKKELFTIYFKNVTILYGGNGSGKSTLLNVIAQKLGLKRVAPFNSAEMFEWYLDACEYELGTDEEGDRWRIPNGSRIITSDDIFDYMLTVRDNNSEISAEKEFIKEEGYNQVKFGKTIQFHGLDDYEDFRVQVLARRKSVSRRQFIKKLAGEEVKLNSNGETALNYFETKLKQDTLYCLDEPENSMSPKMQLELVEMLQKLSRYCGCQFIIATHSPFLLAMEGARIYNLDETPVEIRNWWELENTRAYFDFFQKNAHFFNDSPI